MRSWCTHLQRLHWCGISQWTITQRSLGVKCKLGGLKGLRMPFGTGPIWTRFYSNNEKPGIVRTCKNQTPLKPWVSNCTPSGMPRFRDLLGKTLESPMNGVGGTKPQMERDISESAYDTWEAHTRSWKYTLSGTIHYRSHNSLQL